MQSFILRMHVVYYKYLCLAENVRGACLLTHLCIHDFFRCDYDAFAIGVSVFAKFLKE